MARATAAVREPEAAGRGEPLYARVGRALRDEIAGGTWPVGTQLPTEDELTARFAVSRYTVREALRRLRDEGLVVSRQGAGTVVTPPPADPGTLHATSIDDLLAFARGLDFAVEAIAMEVVERRDARRLGLPAGSSWLTVRGFRHADGVPVCWTEYHIHRDYAAVAERLRDHHGSIFPLVEASFGVRIEEVEQEIAAGVVPPALAAGLDVAEGAAVLEVRRAFRTGDGKLVQRTLNIHPADRFRHSMTMRRLRP